MHDWHLILHHHELAAMDAMKRKCVVHHTHGIVLVLKLLEMMRRSMHLVHIVVSSNTQCIVPPRWPSNWPGGTSAAHHRVACRRRHPQHRGSLRGRAVQHDRSVARGERNGGSRDQRHSRCRRTPQMMPASRHQLCGPCTVFSRHNRDKGQHRRVQRSAKDAKRRMRVGGMPRDRHGPV